MSTFWYSLPDDSSTEETYSECSNKKSEENVSKNRTNRKKLPKKKLCRSSRQGMCLCSGDDTSSADELIRSYCEEITPPVPKSSNNLVEMLEDKILEDFITNYNVKDA